MPLVTVFSTPKPFTNPNIALIQRNAIRSWLQLGPEAEVLLIGKEDGVAEIARELGVRYLPEVGRNASGTPLISSIFSIARENSQSAVLAYVNADIILFPELISIIHPITELDRFLVIGQRYDLGVSASLDFGPRWKEDLLAQVRERGRTHPPRGSDYFIFPRRCFTDLPDFAVGRVGWDNWMIYKAWREKWTIVDATPSVPIVHQDHDYSHLASDKKAYSVPEAQVNVDLAGGKLNTNFTILDANYQLRDGWLQPVRLTYGHVLRKLELFLLQNHIPSRKIASYLHWQIYTRRVKTQRSKIPGNLVRRLRK